MTAPDQFQAFVRPCQGSQRLLYSHNHHPETREEIVQLQ